MAWRWLCLVAFLGCASSASATQDNCRQALAFGLDISGSVDAVEYRLQLDGLATALTSDAVQDMLFREGAAPIDISVYEWSGPLDQTVILPWHTLSNKQALAQAVATLQSHQRAATSPTTALGSAMLTGVSLLNDRPNCWKRTLDISGDGQANTGPRPQDISNSQIPADISINALVIGPVAGTATDQSGDAMKRLSAYFQSNVIRGPQAFVETAQGFNDYAQAMERKILRELTSLAIGSVNP